jgi:hypothetical protein
MRPDFQANSIWIYDLSNSDGSVKKEGGQSISISLIMRLDYQ